ncbi:MAG: chemotaxis protein CheB, partial [Rubrivivax sp.]|nr:chemotaxis protein CheB [Rubrivivax sp.]
LAQMLTQLRDKLVRSGVALPAVVVIQHIDTAFAAGLADWLQQSSGWPVKLAADGDAPAAGSVHMGGALGHLVMTPRGLLSNRREPEGYPYRPSVDEFFYSCRHWRGRGLAALLTGMGNDGAKGLLQLRQRGWLTLAQLPSSCAVGGMPQAAIQLDAAAQVLTPAHIVQTLHDHLLLERKT